MPLENEDDETGLYGRCCEGFVIAGVPDLSPGRDVDVGFVLVEAEASGLSGNRDVEYDEPFGRDALSATEPVWGFFAATPGSSLSALRFGATDSGFEGVEADGAGFSPVMEARRSLI